MFKKKIKKIIAVKIIFNFENKFISRLNFIKKNKNGGKPVNDSSSVRYRVFNFENFIIYNVMWGIDDWVSAFVVISFITYCKFIKVIT
jgi:hypothetical protein